MTALLFVVAFAIVAVLVYMARYSSRVHVVQTRLIDAPPAATRAQVADPGRWPGWSPWPENDAAVENLGARGPERIEQRLRLLRPFPMRGVSSWQLADSDGMTRVTWTVRGKVPFSMRAFAATVQGALALDARYGLDRLASLLEGDDAPRYDVAYEGVRELAAVRYAYVEHTGAIGAQAAAMHDAAIELRAALAREGVQPAGRPMALYLRTHVKRRTTTCRFCLPIGDATVDGVAVATLPPHRAFVASLRGSRTQLEIAWYLAMQRLTVLALRPDLRVTPSEQYLDDTDAPGTPPRTELFIPVCAA